MTLISDVKFSQLTESAGTELFKALFIDSPAVISAIQSIEIFSECQVNVYIGASIQGPLDSMFDFVTSATGVVKVSDLTLPTSFC